MGPPAKKAKKEYSGFCDKAYPDVFNLNAMPEQPKKLKPGQFSEEKVKHFFEKVSTTSATIIISLVDERKTRVFAADIFLRI